MSIKKSPEAFRTISEAAEILELPAHVLRFWESKFTQINPIKRAGGRRFYRPTDIKLLRGIKDLLHIQGMTINGAKKVLRQQVFTKKVKSATIAHQIVKVKNLDPISHTLQFTDKLKKLSEAKKKQIRELQKQSIPQLNLVLDGLTSIKDKISERINVS